MASISRPLQLGFNQQVLEHGRKFYYIVSVIMGINLDSGEPLLEFDFLRDSLECMGDMAMLDMGMPKPRAEVLVTGKCFAPPDEKIHAQKVRIKIGSIEKSLFVFGDRFWKRAGGLMKVITEPLPFREMDISYQNAFGGTGFKKNPLGKGFSPMKEKDGNSSHPLPNIEDPKHLIGSPRDKPEPAGFSSLDVSWPQRAKFQGTYGKDYKRKYFPGYPPDFNWHNFLCAPQDQWSESYFKGNEPFEITHMHPHKPFISGTLPGFYARCFLNQVIDNNTEEFVELPLNLDTIWLFPEKTLGLLIWRKGIEVTDDEAAQVKNLMLAYEDQSDEPRSFEHYRQAFEKRRDSDDSLLDSLNTEDLIPPGHKSAMELLLDMSESGEESELGKNLDAKAESMQKMADEKLEAALQQSEATLASVEMPGIATEKFPGGENLDLKKYVKDAADTKPDPDVEELNRKLEALMPGITGSDSNNLKLKEFSFDKIEKVMDIIRAFSDKKEKEAKNITEKEIINAKEQIKEQISSTKNSLGKMSPEKQDEVLKPLEESLQMLEDLDLEQSANAPLPRLNAEEIIEKISGITPEISPQIMETMQHLQSMRALGYEDENTRNLEKQIQELMITNEKQMKEAEKSIRESEVAFKENYLTVAHFMENGLAPHKEPLETVRQLFLAAQANGKGVAGGDWACIDLSGLDLSGIDLSDTFLEQVNFTETKLKGANLNRAILARANLEKADLSGADLTEANLGGVNAFKTNFKNARLKAAKLSKGNFTQADFSEARLEDVETLEIIVDGADFTQAIMPGIKFLESGFSGTTFTYAELASSIFLNCTIADADFSHAVMKNCIFAEVPLENVCFNSADLTSTCFVSSEPENCEIRNVQFRRAILDSCNFQNMIMPHADMRGASMEFANFSGADLSHADLSLANAKQAFFRKACLNGATLHNIDLMFGALGKANLVNASFLGANLYQADFLRATITNTDFGACNLDATIIEHWRPE